MNSEFDYVIIGAGSAGCVLANRLSADPSNRVLVLEAGGSDNRFWIQTPIGYGKTFYDQDVNWMYTSEAVAGLDNRQSYWPRGKVVGGSSSINAMVYIRGQHDDYNDWRDKGNPGWGWEDVMPYFKKSETNSRGADEYRGGNGPLYVNDPSEDYHPLCNSFLQAAAEYGLPYNSDFNGATQEGVGLYQITTKNGIRMSAARAYLKPALKRKNCQLQIHAHVTRILFEGKRAIGVEYKHKGVVKKVRANNEVILSAGSINSPQVLQLSGLGPAELLAKHDIDVIKALPSVGRNMQEHLGYSHYYKSTVPTLNNELYPWWGKLRAGMQYLLTRKGPLSLSVNQAGGFFKSNPERRRPNLQIYFAAITYTTAPPGERPLMQPDPWPGFLNSICQCRPTSRGEVAISSADPFAHPQIRPNYLSTEEDRLEMLEGARYIRDMSKTPTLSRIIKEEMKPGTNIDTDDALLEDIRKTSDTVFHPTSTCMMGSDETNSVVTHRLQVHGVERLRVVDASVFPNIVSGNTNGPTIMVAEKASDMILEDVKSMS
ncbi:MAG: choline dehydrogenase [Gammaproteobacteria bacterium]|nr:choline dehydrogenase [Gammaproteobacteria bacterium]